MRLARAGKVLVLRVSVFELSALGMFFLVALRF